MNKLYQKTENDSIKYFISKIVYALRSLILLTLYSYLLIPEVYGKYSLIMGIVNILLAIFIGWISSSVKRYYDNYREDLMNFFSNVIFLWLSMNIIMSIIIYIIFTYTNIVVIDGQFFYIFATTITLSLVMISENIVRAARLSKLYLYLIISQSITHLGAFFLIAQYLDGSLASVFLSLIVSNCIFIFIVIRKIEVISYKFNFPSGDFQKKFFNYGFPMVGIWALDWLLNLSDRFIIKLFSTNKFVGIYDINYKIAGNSIGIFAPSIIMGVFPLMVRAWNENNKENISVLLSDSIFSYLVIALPSVFGLIAVRSLLYGSLVSMQYASGELIIVFISIALFFYGLTLLLFSIWQVSERPKIIFYITAFVVIINIILNLCFIPIYGYIFAAVSTFLAYFFSFLITVILSKRNLSIGIDFNRIFKILISSVFMYLAVSAFIKITVFNKGLSLILAIIIGIIVYIMSLYVFGILNKISERIENLKNWW